MFATIDARLASSLDCHVRRPNTLQCVPYLPEGGTLARYKNQHTGSSLIDFSVVIAALMSRLGIDPYLHPVMFEEASHIQCSGCDSINALPINF